MTRFDNLDGKSLEVLPGLRHQPDPTSPGIVWPGDLPDLPWSANSSHFTSEAVGLVLT